MPPCRSLDAAGLAATAGAELADAGPLRRGAREVMAIDAPASRSGRGCRHPGHGTGSRPDRASTPCSPSSTRRLVEGRARHQRDDGRRGPPAAPVPRHRSTPEHGGGRGRWIRSQQRDDGTWATFHGGPADLSTTVEAYVALRLAGDAADAAHIAQRRARSSSTHGGIEATRVFTRLWLALFGVWSWDDLPALPPEVILLPTWFPLNIYDFACWARQTIVPLTVVARAPAGAPAAVRRSTSCAPAPRAAAAARRCARGRARFQRLDRVLHRYERRPLGAGCAGAALAPRPSSGSSTARRPTARGAASSRRGCTR